MLDAYLPAPLSSSVPVSVHHAPNAEDRLEVGGLVSRLVPHLLLPRHHASHKTK
jgi:hypothetical protein